MAAIATYDECHTVGIAYEASLIGEEYLRSTRVACKEYGLRVTAVLGNSTARLIANQASLKTRTASVQSVVSKLREASNHAAP